MKGERPITLKLLNEVHDRAQAVADAMRAKPGAHVMGRISKALVFRLAMMRGLESLEAEYGTAKGSKRRKRGAK